MADLSGAASVQPKKGDASLKSGPDKDEIIEQLMTENKQLRAIIESNKDYKLLYEALLLSTSSETTNYSGTNAQNILTQRVLGKSSPSRTRSQSPALATAIVRPTTPTRAQQQDQGNMQAHHPLLNLAEFKEGVTVFLNKEWIRLQTTEAFRFNFVGEFRKDVLYVQDWPRYAPRRWALLESEFPYADKAKKLTSSKEFKKFIVYLIENHFNGSEVEKETKINQLIEFGAPRG